MPQTHTSLLQPVPKIRLIENRPPWNSLLAQAQQDKNLDHGRLYPAEFGAPFDKAKTSTGTDPCIHGSMRGLGL